MILFVTTEDIRRNTIVNGNVDTDLFINFIKLAQEIHLQNVLGTRLYEKFETLIDSNDIELPAFLDYKNLLIDYIQPMLINYSMVDYIPFASVQIKNGGMFKHRSETGENVTKDETDFLSEKYRSYAEFYSRRFISFMSFNSTKFPE